MKNIFQSFDDPPALESRASRLAALRHMLDQHGLDGFIVPHADEHQSEYIPPHAERLSWLTGFTGSAGNAVILKDKAALCVDGRYILQAAAQVDAALFSIVPIASTPLEEWLVQHLPQNAVLGYDPWLHTRTGLAKLEKAAAQKDARLKALSPHPIDAIWQDQPSPPRGRIWLHPETFAGQSASIKLEVINTHLAKMKLDGLLISDPHNLAWTFNIRGSDVAHTPISFGYALIARDKQPVLFIDGLERFDPAALADINRRATLHPLSQLHDVLCLHARRKKRIRFDRATAASFLAAHFEAQGGIADMGEDPITLMKAVKNQAEMAGARAAHQRDGVAVTRFLAWLDDELNQNSISEIEAVQRLEAFRFETGCLKDISFATIAGSGPNGAIVHYRVTHQTNRMLRHGELFLIDSGAQYEDGTTDITRTVIIGMASPEMKDRFTRVLKGHIAIARAVFPKGTSGAQLDILARASLWEQGLDFDHGTGHGVGSYLSVHEGPQRLSKLGHVPLEPGMILSNEPGYYKQGAYGIRLENLIMVEERLIEGAERPMLGFETLTLAPFDTRVIDKNLLLPHEILWLNTYHNHVYEVLAPHLDEFTRLWLKKVTTPMT
jgi:Xaa-Pro aminopeptidase